MKIPEGVKRIGKKTFYQCLSLRRVDFPSTIKKIDEKAFNSDYYYEEMIIREVTIPKECKLGIEAFGRECKVTRKWRREKFNSLKIFWFNSIMKE